jgi:cell shape-determining protein MreC
MIGKVIFRETTAWSSSFWINIGEKTNQHLGKTVIAKNSPVVIGTSVLGLVEVVGFNRSRIRLITDSSIIPSVRVLRGSPQKQVIVQGAKQLLEKIEMCEEIAKDHPVKKELTLLCQNLNTSGENTYLAKGELRGMRTPHFRSRQALLLGVGFNNDFEDEEGGARNLQSGHLVKKGDILVTTGMDGIFPAGLRVGHVSKVHPLKEGSNAYELDVHSIIENFNDISFVTVLPPLEINENH